MERKGDILYSIVDSFTGEWITYKKVLTWLDGTTMNSTLCDKIIYVETPAYPGEFFRREYSGPADVRWFGATGDGVTDDTAAVQQAINAFTTDYWAGQRGGGQSILFPPGTYLLNDIQIGQGITLISYQLARDNFDSFVPAVLMPLTGVAEYILHNADDSRNCELIGLHIDGDFTNNPQLIAAVRWAGGFQKMINCNINKCAQYAVKSKAGAFVMQDCSIGGWFGAAPTDWTGDDDFRGAVHVEAAGDFYMLNNEISAALPYFTQTGMAVLRDPIHRRICALAGVGFLGNSVVMGNLFENGDRAVVLSSGQYAYWANNRYEFSGGTGLTIIGGNRFMTFNGERFSGNSIAGDGLFSDIELRPGTFGSVTFTATTFMRSFATVEVPAFANRVNYNIDNKASVDINFLGTVYDSTYYTIAPINLTDLASLPIRQDLLQYDVDNVQFASVSTKKLVADPIQTGYVKLTRGTGLLTGNLTGGVQFYDYLDTPKSLIGFNTGNDLWFNLNSVGGQYIFIGGGMFIPKAGGNNITLVSTDLVGTVAFNMSSGPGPDHGFSIVMDSATGNTRFTSGSPMTLGSGGAGNFTILSTGLTLIPTQPTSGDTATSFLLGRNTSTGEMTILDPDLFTPAAVTETANTVWAGPGAGAPNYPTFRLLVQQDIPALPASKLPKATASVDGYLAATDFAAFSAGTIPTLQQVTNTGNQTTGAVTFGAAATPLAQVHAVRNTPLLIDGENTGALGISSGAFVRLYNDGVPNDMDQGLGGIVFGARTSGIIVRNGASISAYSVGAWADGIAHPSYISIATGEILSADNIERVRISEDGLHSYFPVQIDGFLSIGSSAAVITGLGNATFQALTVVGNTTFESNGVPAVGKVPTGTDVSGNWTWQALPAPSGVTSLQTLTGGVTLAFGTGTTGNDNNITTAGSVITLNVPDASATVRGVITTGTQIIAGNKSLTGVTTLSTGWTTGSFAFGATASPSVARVNILSANTSGLYIINSSTPSASTGGFARLMNSGTPSADGQRIAGIIAGTNPTGSTFRTSANIEFYADGGAWTDGTSQPTRITFGTTPTGSATIVTRMTISQAGNVSMTQGLTVSGNTTFAANGTPAAGNIPMGTDASGNWTWTQLLKNTATLDFPSTLATTSSDLTITVTGAALGDVVSLGVPNGSVVAGTSYSAWVSATNTVTVRLSNFSAVSADPASGSFKVYVFKF